MAMKDWFRRSGGKGDGDGYSVDDLIALGQLDEAEAQLRARLKEHRSDLRSRLKLADLLMKLRRLSEAVDEYLIVGEGYARDGFYDKAIALLRKVSKLAPGHEKVEIKIEALQRAKKLEHRRDLVIDGIMARRDPSEKVGSSAFELQKLWREISNSHLIDRLEGPQLQRLFRAMRLRHCKPGEQIVQANQSLEEVYLIAHGEVDVRVTLSTGTDTTLRTFEAGDLIGDRALLEHRPWPADYFAGPQTVLLRLDREGLASALTGESDPKGFLNVLREQRNDHEVAAAMKTIEDRG